MAVEEVTTQSWGQRLAGSVKGIAVGIVLILAGVVLLFWNEGRAVKRAKTLDEGVGIVVSVDAAAVDSGHEGDLVHLSGTATTDETLEDPKLGQSHQAIRLHRRVEMYQWKEEKKSETKKKTGGKTETVTRYEYEKTWSEKLISSSSFKEQEGHENPPSFPLESESWTADDVRLGAFSLGDVFVGQMSQSRKVEITGEDLQRVAASLRPDLEVVDGYFYQAADRYLGADPGSPEVGDVRVSFSVVPPAEVTVVGRQQGNSLVSYKTKAGGTIELLSYGTVAADQMFAQAQKANTVLTWILRLVFFLLITFGFAAVLRPLSVLADVLPFVGNLVEAGTSLVALGLGAVVSLGTIAVGWIVYRPLLGISLLGGSVAVAVWLVVRSRKGTTAPAAIPPPPPPPPPPPVG